MKVYCLIDTKHDKLVAFHENEDVLQIYLENLSHSTSDYDKIRYLKTYKTKFNNNEFNKNVEFHLVPYRKSYIQEGYIDVLDMVDDKDRMDDIRFARETLSMLYQTQTMKKKEKKKILESVELLDSILASSDYYTPDLSTLNTYKDTFEYNGMC